MTPFCILRLSALAAVPAAALALLPVNAAAQTAPSGAPAVAVPAAAPPAVITSYRRLEDMKVVDQSGRSIGEVDSVLIDSNGRVIALAIELERFLGIGEEEVVVGFEHMRYVNNALVISLTNEQIAALPRWDD